MPIYEEKLISPLAIRFTQQRIRENFRDGHEVEATAKQITAKPGVGDYDIILDAPFPAIEIIRWSPNGRSTGGKEHWFTFDNRRLYCLQRVAAEYWPKRVGATVEVLYADSGTIRKKLDSKTGGISVSIGHAFATADELEEWAWRKAVQDRAPPGNFTLKAEAAVVADDAKTSVSDLMDAPSVSSFERLSSEFEAKSCCNPSFEAVAAETVGENHGQVIEAPSTSQQKDNSLTSLIGQLLHLKTEEHLQSHEHASDDTQSTHLSELTESAESEVGISESAAITPSTKSRSDSELVPASDEEDKALEQSVPRDCTAPWVQQKGSGEKASKDTRSKVAQQTKVARMTQAAQMQMAQCQMAQWQMAHAAQMMQWQHSALAYQYQANQAAQLRAAQLAWWQQA